MGEAAWGKKRRIRAATEHVEYAQRALDLAVQRLRDAVDGQPCSHPIWTSHGESLGGGRIRFDIATDPSWCAYCGAPRLATTDG